MIYKSNRRVTYDAIVIGSGITGGLAAKQLCENGLKTLLLERGRDVLHIQDYPTAALNPWDFKYRLNNTVRELSDNPIRSINATEADRLFYAGDKDHPFIQKKPFNWIRGYQVGGKSLIWGRQCYRLSDLDFTANLEDGIGVDWPIRYKDLARWYEYVERYIGISGKCENLAQLPDGHFLPPMELNCIEKHLGDSIKRNDEHRRLIIARVANLTRGWNGRGACQNRNLCSRGCPYGGYFSSNSSTIPAAMRTGNLTLRPFSIVKEIIFDETKGRAAGVRVIDMNTNEEFEFYSKIIFVNASTINSTALLLNSTSSRFPTGLGNDSNELGHNLMDHHSSSGAYGIHTGYGDQYHDGGRPCGFLIPRYRNLNVNDNKGFLRGYNFQGKGYRLGWEEKSAGLKGFGASLKESLAEPGPWKVWMGGWGECLPYHENRISLTDKSDKWGIPLVEIDFSFRENEEMMMKDIQKCGAEILEQAGFSDVESFSYHNSGGTTVHEMGTARMGKDPKTSVLNNFNQIHAVKNVFVTDGSCMASSACQNPSLTYMALTARACAHAINELKSGNI